MGKTIRSRIAGARKSLTIWFNSVIGTVVTLLPVAQDQLPQLQPYIGPHFYQYMMGFVVGANILLRFKTTTDLKDK